MFQKTLFVIMAAALAFIVGVVSANHCPVVQKFAGVPAAHCKCNCGCDPCVCGPACPCPCGCGQTGECKCHK